MKTIVALILPIVTLAISATAASATQGDQPCGKVTIADMNWNSASFLAHVDHFILKHGYGCDAELVPGDTMPTGISMIEKGQPDIAPELWSNTFKAALDKGINEKRLRVAGYPLSDGGEEGFWVPKYLVDKNPSLATIQGIIKHAKLFPHPEDPSRSAFMGCPAGWGCQITTSNLFAALSLAKAGFEIIDPGSSAGLAGTIAKAYARKEPWFGYYWSPTAILGKYKMVKVDFSSGTDEAHYINCISKPDCENPRITMYPASVIHTITTEKFATRMPQVLNYLAKRAFKNAQMNTLLAWMEDNQSDEDRAMEYFLKTHQKTWAPWVADTVASKVKRALNDL